jgi:hypothetical protein
MSNQRPPTEKPPGMDAFLQTLPLEEFLSLQGLFERGEIIPAAWLGTEKARGYRYTYASDGNGGFVITKRR